MLIVVLKNAPSDRLRYASGLFRGITGPGDCPRGVQWHYSARSRLWSRSRFNTRAAASGGVPGQRGLVEILAVGVFEEADADFQIFDAGTLSGTFSAVLLPDLPGMLGWDSSRLYSSGTLSVIPEPATLSLVAMSTLMLLRRRR